MHIINDFIKRCSKSKILDLYGIDIEFGRHDLLDVFHSSNEYIFELKHSNTVFYFPIITAEENVSFDFVIDNMSSNIDSFFELNSSTWSDKHYSFINQALEDKYRLEGLELIGGTLDVSWGREHVSSVINDYILKSNVDKSVKGNFIEIYSYVIEELSLEVFHLEMGKIEKKILAGLL